MNIDWENLIRGVNEVLEKSAETSPQNNSGSGGASGNNVNSYKPGGTNAPVMAGAGGMGLSGLVGAGFSNANASPANSQPGGTLNQGPGWWQRTKNWANENVPGLKQYNQISNVASQAGDVVSSLAGAAPVMLAGMLSGGGGGGAGGGTVVNNYYGKGGQPMKPSIFNMGPGEVASLTSPKFAEAVEKKANILAASLANAATKKLADKLIDDTDKQATPDKSKEIEIVSKYPEMAKLLEDEQNKAYLNRLLKD